MHARLQAAFAAMRTRSEDGQALVEYSLIIALIALTAFMAMKATGTHLSTMFNGISSDV
jgi:Flp pilus assembly pilin Flp